MKQEVINMEILTLGILQSIVGKKIMWIVDIYQHNIGHYGYGLDGGECIIEEIGQGKKPILKAKIIKGADITHAFVDYKDWLAYSDGDRIINFSIIESEN